MEILVKGSLGALVAILLHFAANSKHYYLTGLIPLFPTFALFAHIMFVSSARVTEMQVSALFGMLSLIPYGVYLILIWTFALRVNSWTVLAIAVMGWLSIASIIVALWHKIN